MCKNINVLFSTWSHHVTRKERNISATIISLLKAAHQVSQFWKKYASVIDGIKLAYYHIFVGYLPLCLLHYLPLLRLTARTSSNHFRIRRPSGRFKMADDVRSMGRVSLLILFIFIFLQITNAQITIENLAETFGNMFGSFGGGDECLYRCPDGKFILNTVQLRPSRNFYLDWNVTFSFTISPDDCC